MKDGAGLVLILGEDISEQDVQKLLGMPVTVTTEDEALSLVDGHGVDDPILEEIVWNGAPQVRERSHVEGLDATIESVVQGYTDGQGILLKGLSAEEGSIGNGVFILTPWLSGEANPQIQEWGYFNYFIYHLVERAAGDIPMTFAAYPASPVPHADDRNVLLIFLAVELIIFFGAFIIVRRYSMAHPEVMENLVSDRKKFEGKRSEDGLGEGGLPPPTFRVAGGNGNWNYSIYPPDHLPKFNPSPVYPSLSPGAWYVGTCYPILWPNLGAL